MQQSKKNEKKDSKKEKFRLQARSLFLTYPKCYMDKSRAQDLLLANTYLPQINYILIAQETHEDGHRHLHAYIQLNDKCNITNANALDLDHCHGNYQAAKGFWHDSWNYLTKEDQNPLEWGTPSKARNKADQTKEGIARRNKMLAESDLVALVQSGEIEIERYLTIKKAVTAFKMDSVQIGGYVPDRFCIWICDTSGAGKSRFLRDNLIPFYTKPQNKWWDGYKQEQVILLEDFDKVGTCLSHYLKIWSDVYSFYGEVKGGTVPCNYKVFVITSQYFPNQLWKEEDDPELIKAIDRRFKFYSVAMLGHEKVADRIIEIINKNI